MVDSGLDPGDATAVVMRGIVKRYDRVLALDDVDLTVGLGVVHAVVGENGAGKTTLMQILAGVVRADAGNLAVRGKQVEIRSVEDAYALRIAMVHQHFMLFPSLTVAENVTIGREPWKHGLFDKGGAESVVAELSSRYGLRVDPGARVGQLSVGDLQRVEILRALFRGAEILILDEPTGVLTPQETKGLFGVIRDLTAAGKTTIFISHKLEEVLGISESITVLRDGKVTGVLRTVETDEREIARLMVGREVFLEFAKTDAHRGEPLLELVDLSGAGVKRVALQVNAGEIVGVAGIAGNGQSELAELVAGLMPVSAGSLRIGGRDVTNATVAERRRAGLAYIPDDRYKRGLASGGTVSENLIMGAHGRSPVAHRGLINSQAVLQRARSLVSRFQIKTESVTNAVDTLSGGNAQRVVVARELADDKPLIVASQPTRGIDIAATEFVRGELLKRRDAGAGVLLISADLAEIMSLSDRIVVMYRGEIIGEVSGKSADEIGLGLLMAGVRKDKATNRSVHV